MEHPLIGNLADQTLEQLGAKVNELQKKLAIAQSTGNGHLANQVRMALETYYNTYQAKLKQSYSQEAAGSMDFDSKISIQ